MSSLVLTIKSEQTSTEIAQLYQKLSSSPKEEAIAVAELMRSVAGGIKPIAMDVHVASSNPVAASGTFTLDTVIATDVVLIGAITLTGTDTPTTSLHFDTDAGSDTLIAASIASTINAHAVLSLIVVATSAAAVVTVTARQKGVLANQLAISSPDSTITASAAYLAGGTGGVSDDGISYDLGIA